MPLFASDLPPARKRTAVALVSASLLTVLTLSTTGCSSPDDWSAPRSAAPTAAPLAKTFLAPDAAPSPGATVTPRPDSWVPSTISPGYRVVLVEAEYDPKNSALADGVRGWADQNGAVVKSVRAASPHAEVTAITEAMALHGDLIVSSSPDMVDALALVTASHLDEQFLLIGAQLPEPTENVTAAVWPGASSRGSEVANPADADREDAYTSASAERAMAAGAAAVLNGLTGLVIDVR